MTKHEEYGVCSYCNGVAWCIRSEKKNERYFPFVFPCPMCNPHKDRPPIDVDREEIHKLLDERKKIVPKEKKEG